MSGNSLCSRPSSSRPARALPTRHMRCTIAVEVAAHSRSRRFIAALAMSIRRRRASFNMGRSIDCGRGIGDPLTPLLMKKYATPAAVHWSRSRAPTEDASAARRGRFPANDDPVEMAQRRFAIRKQRGRIRQRRCVEINRPKQRLARDEAHGGRRLQQVRNAFVGFLLAFCRYAEPDVGERQVTSSICAAAMGLLRRCDRRQSTQCAQDALRNSRSTARCSIPHPLGALREHLKRVLRAERHDGEHAVDPFVGD